MKFFLYLISLMYIAGGCYYILYTDATRGFIKRMLAKTPMKLLAILPFLVGLLLVLAAPASNNTWFVRLLGLLGLVKGGLMFLNPKGLWDKVTQWYLAHLSDQIMRLTGILTLILGTVIFSWIL